MENNFVLPGSLNSEGTCVSINEVSLTSSQSRGDVHYAVDLEPSGVSNQKFSTCAFEGPDIEELLRSGSVEQQGKRAALFSSCSISFPIFDLPTEVLRR